MYDHQAIPEPWVDSGTVAKHIGKTRSYVNYLTRIGVIRGHPLTNGKRHCYAYRLSEVDESLMRLG